MDFALTDEQREIREIARRFAERDVAPCARAIDESAEFDWGLHRRLSELGFLGMTVPDAYGGSSAATITWCVVVEEIARASSAVANGMTLTESMAHYLAILGTEEQKRTWLPKLCHGQSLCSFGLTEPDAGSDAASVATTARMEGDQVVLNGRKMFISGALLADFFIVVATVDRAQRSKGVRTYIVPKETPGLSLGPKLDLLGIRGFGTAPVFLDECRIPLANQLGGNQGFREVMRGLDGPGRMGASAMAVGVAQAAMDAALAYALQRKQFDRPIFDFQAVQGMLADMSTEIDAARLLLHKAAWRRDQGLPFTKESSHAKLFAAAMCQRAVNGAMQVFGGYAYVKDFPVERFYRDARIHAIWDGTDQVQRIIIARHLAEEHA